MKYRDSGKYSIGFEGKASNVKMILMAVDGKTSVLLEYPCLIYLLRLMHIPARANMSPNAGDATNVGQPTQSLGQLQIVLKGDKSDNKDEDTKDQQPKYLGYDPGASSNSGRTRKPKSD